MGKPGFKWKDRKERNLYEFVMEDGSLKTKDILFIIKKVCILIRSNVQEGRAFPVHPKKLVLTSLGEIKESFETVSLSSCQLYLPPESEGTIPFEGNEKVYSLGMLMLFMATGKEKKMDARSFVSDRFLLDLIERCTAFDPKERFRDETELLEFLKKKKRLSNKILPVLLITVFIGFFVLSGLYFWEKGGERGKFRGDVLGYEKGYSEGYEQGVVDAPGIGIRSGRTDPHNGNLSGNYNINEGSVAARSEDEIFYVWEGDIFRMNPYTQKQEILAEGKTAYSLNYYDGRLYYCSREKVYCIDPLTGKEERFSDAHSGFLYIYQDHFYLYDKEGTGYLYRIHPKNGTLTQLNGAMVYHCLNILNGKLYYIDKEKGGSICSCDPDGGNVSLISSNSYSELCIHNERLYAAGEIGLIRMDLNGGNPEILTASSVRFPNVSDGGIFYISAGNGHLEWMSLDGKMTYTVIPVRTADFNVAGQWIFYQNEEDNGNWWRIRINGSDKAKLIK